MTFGEYQNASSTPARDYIVRKGLRGGGGGGGLTGEERVNGGGKG